MKRLLLWFAKYLGVIALARLRYSKNLRILCYHGIALDDEHLFRPRLFMTVETFTRRMAHLASCGYSVITLDEAVLGLKKNALPRGATVITIDDGWYGSYSSMAPLLQRFGFPATIYVSSYYVEHQTQVFNVAADYVLWKSRHGTLDLSELSDDLTGSYRLSDSNQRDQALKALNEFAARLRGADSRQALLRQLCRLLGLDWCALEAARLLSFMNVEEARKLPSMGVDLQLHTHRHSIPGDSFEGAKAEIEENRRVLARLTEGSLRHFCYPSGDHKQHTYEWLKALGIVSAATTVQGLNRTGSSPYALRRLMDSEEISDLEFEAEMSGFFEIVRYVKHLFRGAPVPLMRL